MMNNYVQKQRQEWLNEEIYLVDDVYSDWFAVNFEKVKRGVLIEKGFRIEEPDFKMPF